MIDTHLHIPQLPDDGFGDADDGSEDDDGEDGPGGVDQALYDAIAEEDQPLLGRTVTIDQIVCTLQHEGSTKAFAFFPTFLDVQEHLIEVARRTMDAHPSLFVPFIQASGNLASIVEPQILQDFLDIQPDLYFGLGEVGDSPTEPINPPPDSKLSPEKKAGKGR